MIKSLHFFAVFMLGFLPSLWSDEVRIWDGSVLQGEILGLDDGNLTLATDFAGEIKIPKTKISSIFNEEEISFRMEDNRTFKGRARFGLDGNFTIDDQNEEFTLSGVRQLWTDESDDPLILSAREKAEALLLKWKHSVGFDLTGSSGNSDNFGLGIRMDSSLSNEFRGYDLYLSYNKADQKSTPVEDETKLGIEYDSRFFDALAWYAKADLEKDEIEEIDLRATSAVGLKYSWIEEIDYEVSVRSGLAFRYEKTSASNHQDMTDPAIDLGLEYVHYIKNSLSLESDLSYVPSLANFDKFLITQDTAVIFPIDSEAHWNLRSGLSGSYNSTPGELNEELDLKYYLRLVFLFQ